MNETELRTALEKLGLNEIGRKEEWSDTPTKAKSDDSGSSGKRGLSLTGTVKTNHEACIIEALNIIISEKVKLLDVKEKHWEDKNEIMKHYCDKIIELHRFVHLMTNENENLMSEGTLIDEGRKYRKAITLIYGESKFPDLNDYKAVQRFKCQEIICGQEFLNVGLGYLEDAVEHLAYAVAVSGNPEELLQTLQQDFPPKLFKTLLERLPAMRQRIFAQGQPDVMAEEDVEEDLTKNFNKMHDTELGTELEKPVLDEIGKNEELLNTLTETKSDESRSSVNSGVSLTGTVKTNNEACIIEALNIISEKDKLLDKMENQLQGMEKAFEFFRDKIKELKERVPLMNLMPRLSALIDEGRKLRKSTTNKSGERKLPDPKDDKDVQRFFLQENLCGEELTAVGLEYFEDAVEHLANSYVVCVTDEDILQDLQEDCPPKLLEKLCELLPTMRQRISAQGQLNVMAEEDVE